MSRTNTILLNDGNKIPVVGLGTGNLTQEMKDGKYREYIERAIDIGYRHFDTAWVYGSHVEIGHGVKNVLAKGKIKREDLFITTKIWNTFHAKQRVLNNCKMSLEELNMDFVDLLLIHFPIGFEEGGEGVFRGGHGKHIYSDVDYLETWRGLEECLENGWTRSIGVSNFNTNQLKRLLENCKIKPAVNQVEMHPYLPQNDLLQFCKQNDIVVTAFSPLGAPYERGIVSSQPEPNNTKLTDNPVINQVAKNHGKTPAQVCLRWAVQRRTVVIPKTTTESRMVENFDLNDQEMRQINDLACNWRAFTLDMFKDHPYFPF